MAQQARLEATRAKARKIYLWRAIPRCAPDPALGRVDAVVLAQGTAMWRTVRKAMSVLVVWSVFLGMGGPMDARAKTKNIYGRVETVCLQPEGVQVKAKLDTGAKTSSLDARDIQLFEKNGKVWVRFVHPVRDSTQKVKFERPLVRVAKIKHRAGEIDEEKEEEDGDEIDRKPGDTYEERPVVKLEVGMGSKKHEVEVNLADRGRFNYPMLVGRSAMQKFRVLIDPELTFTSPAPCGAKKASDKKASDKKVGDKP